MIEFNALKTDDFVKGILDGNKIIISRAITLLESSLHEHQQKANIILQQCLPHTGNSMRIGITGVPGAGKSTFIESIGNLIIPTGKKIAVLAVDPTSKKTGGSILGDKTRMEILSKDKNVFIRPTAAGNYLGGIAFKTRETILLLEAAGYDVIFIETVGVGQNETAVYSMVDFFLLLLLASAGDELQGMKRGIMEMADIICINKCDGDNVQRCKIAKAEFKRALHLFPPNESGWQTQVETCSALTGDGLKNIWENILQHEQLTKETGYFNKNRKQQLLHWFHEQLQQQMNRHFFEKPFLKAKLAEYEAKITTEEITPSQAVNEIMSMIF